MKKFIGSEKLGLFDMIVFVVSIILQNFALITTSSFGIAFSTCVLVYFFIKYKMLRKVTKKLIIFILVAMAIMVGNGVLNGDLKIVSYARVLMIVFDIWVAYQYIMGLSKKFKRKFLIVFEIGFIAMCLYGFYEFFAQLNMWPRILNYLNNNPSYGVRDLYAQNLGWSNTNRIFGCFLEPSFYSVFLVFGYLLLVKFRKMNKAELVTITLLFGSNLFLSSARTGVLFLILIVVMMAAKKILKNKLNTVLKAVCVAFPVLVLFASHTIGLSLFSDSSIGARSYSSMYYLENSLGSVEEALFGHGAGSTMNMKEEIYVDNVKIENHAHNGYVEILYQYGFFALVLLVMLICRLLEKLPGENQLFMYAEVFALFSTGELFNVETFAIMVSITYGLSTIRGGAVGVGKK